MEKKKKCIKCKIYYKDRKNPEEKDKVYENLCMKCMSLWKSLGLIIQAHGNFAQKLKRDVRINLDNIEIRKIR